MDFNQDALAIQLIKPRDMKNEPQLYARKWFDYKFMHPMTATELFMKEYEIALRRGIRQRTDFNVAKFASVLKDGLLSDQNKATITGLWKSRRQADSMGIEYGHYCRFAMNYALLCNWTYLPKPYQMYSKKMPENGSHSMLSYIEESWSQIEIPDLSEPHYRPENFCGHPYQNEYLRLILKRIKKSKHKPGAVATYVFNRKLISEELLIKFFGDEATIWIERAKPFINQGTN
jgi:hypothetical protein